MISIRNDQINVFASLTLLNKPHTVRHGNYLTYCSDGIICLLPMSMQFSRGQFNTRRLQARLHLERVLGGPPRPSTPPTALVCPGVTFAGVGPRAIIALHVVEHTPTGTVPVVDADPVGWRRHQRDRQSVINEN